MSGAPPIRIGMVGGGNGAAIGGVHRLAARRTGRFDLLAGALSSTPAKARASGTALGLARVYDDYQTMAHAEAALANGIQAVIIVTPPHLHGEIAQTFLTRGIHVICDKPLTATLAQAERLEKAAQDAPAQLILTHNYSAYPMIDQMRQRLAAGEIGALQRVEVTFLQDILLRHPDRPQMQWRGDPARGGPGGVLADLGTHALQLLRDVTGDEVAQLRARLGNLPGRVVPDTAQVEMQLTGGASGHLHLSQAAAGSGTDLHLRAIADKGTLVWSLAAPDRLWRGGELIVPDRPGAELNGFVHVYQAIADQLSGGECRMPVVPDGVAGMRFVGACLSAARQGAGWVAWPG